MIVSLNVFKEQYLPTKVSKHQLYGKREYTMLQLKYTIRQSVNIFRKNIQIIDFPTTRPLDRSIQFIKKGYPPKAALYAFQGFLLTSPPP